MNTKIVCTIGPASSSRSCLKRMIQAGMSVARVNFSHGTHQSNGELLKNIRQTAYDLKKNVAILTDLQGPRIRVSSVIEDLPLKIGQSVVLYEKINSSKIRKKLEKNIEVSIGIDSIDLLKYLQIKDQVFLDNGMMELRVEKKVQDGFLCKVVVGGVLKSRKGVNSIRLSSKMTALTKSDLENLRFALSQNIDFVAMSFVKKGEDIVKLKSIIKKMLPGSESINYPDVIAKIETKEAVENFDGILAKADGIMIARGDLALEQPMERIPRIQKEIISKCLKFPKPVIVATQMLESMMENPLPTRAEITDVANAVIDHTDATMLSGESAMGKYPVKTVQTMARIINNTEESPLDDLDYHEIKTEENAPFSFVAKSATILAQEMGIRRIIIKDTPFFMVQKVARFRPPVKIFYYTKNKNLARKLAVIWGAEAIDTLSKIKQEYILVEGITNEYGKIEYKIKRKANAELL